SDYGGNEQWDVFLVSPVNGEVVNLTNTLEIAELDPTWSPDGTSLAYTVKPKTSSVYEIYTMNIETKVPRQLTKGTPDSLTNSIVCWSHDGRTIIYNQSRADDKNANVFSLD